MPRKKRSRAPDDAGGPQPSPGGLPAGGEGLLVLAESTKAGRVHAIHRTVHRAWCTVCPRWTATEGGLRNLIRAPCRPQAFPQAKRQLVAAWKLSQRLAAGERAHLPVPIHSKWICQACGQRSDGLGGFQGPCHPGRVHVAQGGAHAAVASSQRGSGHRAVRRAHRGGRLRQPTWPSELAGGSGGTK